jgi:peroxiredoxin
MALPEVGSLAPDIDLPACVGNRRDRFVLSSYRGRQNVVLVFYVLNWTAV